jgi:hypothetical protein
LLGLPQKNGRKLRMFDYEREIYEALQENKYIWIKKATGLGITEFMLRYIAWKSLFNDEWKGNQVCVVTGPNEELAVKLIDRLKSLFPVSLISREKGLYIRDCWIQAYPSHHLDSMRSLINVKFVLLDEADFFPPGQQELARSVSERYIAKSDPHIVMVSTPNMPGGLFDRMERDDNDKMYHKIFMPYTKGIGSIYTTQEIEEAKCSPSFEREYNLKYGYGVGNVFLPEHIEKAIQLGIENLPHSNPDYNPSCSRALGIDPAFGSSKFAFVVTELLNSMITVLYATEFDRPDYEAMVSHTYTLMRQYKIDRVYIDGSNRAMWSSLKNMIGESIHDNEQVYESDTIVPVNFGSEHRIMLSELQNFVSNRTVAIHPNFGVLILQMRVARTNANGKLEKDSGSQMDLLDALRLACKHYSYS